MPLAVLHEISKWLRTRVVLERVSLALRPDEVTALLGPNVAGNTAAVRVRLGLVRADAGAACVLGLDPRASASRTALGGMLQTAQAPDILTVCEHLKLFPSYYPIPLGQVHSRL